MEAYALELRNVTKRFGSIIANKNVNLALKKGEILAVLGENGSGKTTLMNMIAGIYFPDEGDIYINGEKVVIASPKDAFRYKIGMVHQHFKLIDVFTAAENIVLGVKDGNKRLSKATESVKAISDKYGFELDPKKKIYEMSVSEKQTVEILKVLYRGADILILDEPTAVLTPQETRKLFSVMRRMKEDGKSIIIITHKMHEVMEISDRVAILRKGEYIDTVETAKTNENELTEMMVGKKVALNIDRTDPVDPKERLRISGLNIVNKENLKTLSDVSFSVYGGEILGIAGIAGSGQRELLEAVAGLQQIESGEITYFAPQPEGEEKSEDEPVNLRDKTPLQIRDLGVRLSFVPEDRLGMGLVGNMDIIDNMMLRSYRRGKSVFVDRKPPHELADEIIKSLEVVTPGATTPVRRLSGGNVQKVLVGREIAAAPTVLMAAYPVRGLDINSSYMIYNLLNQQKQRGVAVIFVGEDLDVLTELCDRILVLCGGKITGILDGRKAQKEEIGLLMTKVEGGHANEGREKSRDRKARSEARAAHPHNEESWRSDLEVDHDTRDRDRCRACHLRDPYDALYGRQSLVDLRLILLRRFRRSAQDMGHNAKSRHPARYSACRNAGFQNEVLEHRSRGSGTCRRTCDSDVYVLARREDPRLVPHHRDVHRGYRGGNALGHPSRDIQGKVEYQRNAFHAYDELCGDTAYRVVPQDSRQIGIQYGRTYGAEIRLAPRSFRSEIPFQYHSRRGADGSYLHLSEIQ